ncbi:MAG: dTDP-4-dehydrorhamnose reductase [Vicinamibacterales bacterium]
MNVVVFGANGQLGQSIVARLSSRYAVTACTRQQVDVANHDQVRAFTLDLGPHAIINCAAYNNVDAAEDDPRAAFEVNALAVRTLSRAAGDAGAVFVHYSTDFVFNGSANEPYTEEETPEPQSVYAQSKLVGEWMAAICPRHYVLRVESLFGGPLARSSVDTIIAALRDGRSARVFTDRWVSPSFVDDVVEATAFLLSQSTNHGPQTAPSGVEGSSPAFGLYHCVNTGAATWLEVGREVARLLNRPADALAPVAMADVTLRALRPRYAALDNTKLAQAGFAMPTWQDALARYLERADA